MSNLELINGSCLDQETDAIVNAANRNLFSGVGICGAIFKKAGYKELTELSGDFNFVKPDDYNADKEAFTAALAEQVTTKVLNLTGSKVEVQNGVLQVDSESIAKSSDVPIIEVLTQSEYDNLEKKEENTYYYTYDEDTIYVTQAELNQKLKSMQDQINALSQTLSTLGRAIEDIQALLPKNE